MRKRSIFVALAWGLVLGVGGSPTSVCAHGFAGKRFFPATLSVDDPFVADELTLPAVFYLRKPSSADEPASAETSVRSEVAKRLTPDLGFSLGGGVTHLDPNGKPSVTGFDDLEVGLKYQVFENDGHETILAAGLNSEVGGTGRRLTGAESSDVLTPAVFFGKGFGDLPDILPFLKPLALTGMIGGRFPTERNPDLLQWGLVAEYSLPFLESFVRDIGLAFPLSRMIPVVELSLQTPLDRGRSPTTGP